MRVLLPTHRLSVDPSDEWVADAMEPETVAAHGLYLRSIEHGVYFNLCAQDAGQHPPTPDGLRALLEKQNWASAPFDEWVVEVARLTVVGGTFETIGMGGEVVLEVYVTDGRRVANLVGPGERSVIAAVTASVQRLAGSVRFE